MKAVVMAGGEGSRLRPLTINRPKPLVPICNRPLMEHILALLVRNSITDVVATLHYRGEDIQDYFGDGSAFGVNLQYSLEDEPLGTAGSVKKAEALVRSDEPFVIISGDALTDLDLTPAIQFHRSKKALVTVVLARVPNPLDFGIVITDSEGKIERFLEKPGWSEVFSDTVNTGIYILEPEIFDLIEPEVEEDWSGDVFPGLISQGKPLYGFVTDAFWTDIGSIAQYMQAQEKALNGDVALLCDSVFDGERICVRDGAIVDDHATLIPPVHIGKNCRIKGGSKVGPHTVIGENTIVEEFATVERSTLWNDTYIGADVSLAYCIVGEHAVIKRGCVVSEGSVIGDRTVVDAGTTIRPRVKIWPDKIIERGSTVTSSLIHGSTWRSSLFRDLGVAGLSNVELTPEFASRLGGSFATLFPLGSKIVISRDSTRSSRMIKRALIASLNSAGCTAIDLRGTPLPICRYFVRSSGVAGAINVRKLPGNARMSLIELLSSSGTYLSRQQEKKVEALFFREDSRRADSDDLGIVEYSSYAIDEYRTEFLRQLDLAPRQRRLKIACDYGYSAVANVFPTLLAEMGVDSISLNNYNDAKLAPRTSERIASHLANLSHIISSLGYDMGVLFTEEGERITIIDDRGNVLSGNELFAAMSLLAVKVGPGAKIAMTVTAPAQLEEILSDEGVIILRTKADVRSLMDLADNQQVTLAGDGRGGFIFPNLHPGFDAMFAFGKLVELLQKTGDSLGDLAAKLPKFKLAYMQVKCPWERKGSVMRQLSEIPREGQVELLDGIKMIEQDSWALILPDSIEPLFHVYAESASELQSRQLAGRYVALIERFALKTDL